MNEKFNNQLNLLTKKVIVNSKIESPSINFTNLVMSQIEVINKKQTTVYKPLISKTTWYYILIGFLISCLYTIFSKKNTNHKSWFGEFYSDLVQDNTILNMFSDLKFSKTLLYASIFFGLMIFIQIIFLKNYFNNRFKI